MPKKHIKHGFSTSNRYSKHGIERVVERVVSNNPNDLKKKKQKRIISKATKNVKQAKKNFFACIISPFRANTTSKGGNFHESYVFNRADFSYCRRNQLVFNRPIWL